MHNQVTGPFFFQEATINMNPSLESPAPVFSTSDWAPATTHYSANGRRSPSVGFTSRGTWTRNFRESGSAEKAHSLASLFPRHNTIGLLHVCLYHEHWLPMTNSRTWVYHGWDRGALCWHAPPHIARASISTGYCPCYQGWAFWGVLR